MVKKKPWYKLALSDKLTHKEKSAFIAILGLLLFFEGTICYVLGLFVHDLAPH